MLMSVWRTSDGDLSTAFQTMNTTLERVLDSRIEKVARPLGNFGHEVVSGASVSWKGPELPDMSVYSGTLERRAHAVGGV